MPAHVDAATLRDWLTHPDRPRLIDVRSAAEFRAAHIPGAYNVPLPLLREHRAEFAEPLNEQIVLICRSDKRASEAEQILAAAGLSRLHVLTGGMQAWQREGGAVNHGEGRWDLERQVRLVAGGIVATGVLTSTVAPKAKWLSGAIGAGLMTAALTDSCLMGSLLSKLPYNRDLEPDAADVIAALAR
ncbi:MAG: rhodanese-like domain-containing protein [Austwickia sp.]|nr:MAG: rhodanese-like domain-containing protein [Austwickia sp.]